MQNPSLHFRSPIYAKHSNLIDFCDKMCIIINSEGWKEISKPEYLHISAKQRKTCETAVTKTMICVKYIIFIIKIFIIHFIVP